MNSLIPLYVTMRSFVEDRVERFRRPEDRGAGVVEYAAMLVLAGALVVALMETNIDTELKEAVQEALGDLFGGGEGGDE